MKIKGKSILVTGASRGIGDALVTEALARDAGIVYAGMRTPVRHPDSRVVPVKLDVTSPVDIQTESRAIGQLDILVSNAGVFPYGNLTDATVLQEALRVNLWGPYEVTRAFLPLLIASRGAIVANVSVAAIAPIPLAPEYAISKAAAHSMFVSCRMLLARQGVSVHTVLTGPVDTDMTAGLEIPKASPASVAEAIFSGVENGEEDIFPDVMSAGIADAYRISPAKLMEAAMSADFIA
jgi:NAD(P)-dependent dehydrogenase (short-subunit alcohol dehydrogenase family)